VSQSSQYQKLTADFQALFDDLRDEGYFKPSPIRAMFRFLEVVFYLRMGYIFFTMGVPVLSRVLGILFWTCAGVRSAFAMHEGGHASLTGNVKFDKCLQAIFLSETC